MSARRDAVKAFLAVAGNGWGAGDALKAAQMVFSAGGFGGLSNGNYWPNSFRKLTDPWHERAGLGGTGLSPEAFWRNSTVQSCLAWIQKTYPEPRLMVVEGEGEDAEEVPGHPLTQLLNRPNPHYTPHRLWQTTLSDWWIWGNGNAYWKVVRSYGGEPLELWPLPAREMEPDWPKDGSAYLSHYRRTVNGRTETLKPQEVVHFRFGQDPLNSRKGVSPLMVGGAEVGTLNEGVEYRGALIHNHGLPSYSFTPTSESDARTMSPEKGQILEKMWVAKHTGRNRGSLFISNMMGKLERVGFSPQELDIRELLAWDADMVCALFGLSSMLLGLPSGEKHRTFNNMGEARTSAFEANIMPTQALFAADLELQLLPLFERNPRRHLRWDYSQVRGLSEDVNKRWERTLKAENQEVLTPDETRKALGYKPLEDGSGKLPRRRPAPGTGLTGVPSQNRQPGTEPEGAQA